MPEDLYIRGVVEIPVYGREGDRYVEVKRVTPWLFRGMYELAVGFGGPVAYNLSTVREMEPGDTFCCYHHREPKWCRFLRTDDVRFVTGHLLALKAAIVDPDELRATAADVAETRARFLSALRDGAA